MVANTLMGLTFNDSSEGCVSRTVKTNLAFSLGEEQIEGIIPIFYLNYKKYRVFKKTLMVEK